MCPPPGFHQGFILFFFFIRWVKEVGSVFAAASLKSVVFWCWINYYDIERIEAEVESIQSPHSKEVILHMPGDLRAAETVVRAQW
jgi:hypothetical protein